jgi:ATP-dependent 26S proteasome regulatory subunit
LVLPDETKNLVLAFAQSQIRREQTFDDVIQGKGRGVIMLLSGPPGVGKTLTADAVAENMQVTLYMMAAGDLVTHPAEVEKSLLRITNMTTRWKVVLLLDEADV